MPRKAVDSEVRLRSLNLKTTEALRARLEEAAGETGRALTHEVEARLEQSFLAGDILEKLFGGPKTLKMFLKTALWLQTRSTEEFGCHGDEWIVRADDDFLDELSAQLSSDAQWEVDTNRPITMEEATASRTKKRAPMPEGAQFASPEEMAKFKPVVPQRARRPK